MKKSLKWILGILLLIILLALAVSTDWGANQAAKVLKKPVAAIKAVAKSVLLIALGVFIITVGAGLVPVSGPIGLGMIALGLSLVGWGAYPLFTKSTNPGPMDLKTY